MKNFKTFALDGTARIVLLMEVRILLVSPKEGFHCLSFAWPLLQLRENQKYSGKNLEIPAGQVLADTTSPDQSKCAYDEFYDVILVAKGNIFEEGEKILENPRKIFICCISLF